MITNTVLEARLLDIVAPSLAAAGYRVVQLKLMENQRRRVLSCIAERLDDQLMTIEDCEAISTTMSALLDVEDPIPYAYQLEVSSPGLDRPLTRIADFELFKGHEAQIEMVMPVDGRKRFRAVIEAVSGDDVHIAFEKKELILPFQQMKTAKLVISEALFRDLLNSEEKIKKFEKQKKKRADKNKKRDHKKVKTGMV